MDNTFMQRAARILFSKISLAKVNTASFLPISTTHVKSLIIHYISQKKIYVMHVYKYISQTMYTYESSTFTHIYIEREYRMPSRD